MHRCWSAERPVRAARRAAAAASIGGLTDREIIIAGVPRSDLVLQLQIHETADVESANRFWLTLTGARPAFFGKDHVQR